MFDFISKKNKKCARLHAWQAIGRVLINRYVIAGLFSWCTVCDYWVLEFGFWSLVPWRVGVCPIVALGFNFIELVESIWCKGIRSKLSAHVWFVHCFISHLRYWWLCFCRWQIVRLYKFLFENRWYRKLRCAFFFRFWLFVGYWWWSLAFKIVACHPAQLFYFKFYCLFCSASFLLMMPNATYSPYCVCRCFIYCQGSVYYRSGGKRYGFLPRWVKSLSCVCFNWAA